ncbi:MAG TPA: 50S ribosomal protein L35 [Candidatus Saccharimonadales bacterium]|nr:50S ribosomal protein L35 [Candidatus Saccharimonadales bacterium]
MPKLKTHSGIKKRFRLTKNGKVLRRHSMRNHFLQKKSASRKRRLAGSATVSGRPAKHLKRKLGA